MRYVLAGALSILLLASCEPEEPRGSSFPSRSPMSTPTGSDSLVIGVVGTLSESADAYSVYFGQDVYEGADLAVHQLQVQRADRSRSIELVARDDRGDPQRAAELVEELARDPRTIGIVYVGPPEVLPRVEPALAAAGIPAVLCFGDLYTARKLTPHVFQASPPLLWQARVLARYLTNDRGYERIGVVTTDGLTGRTARNSLAKALSERGARPPVTARWSREPEMLGALKMLRRKDVEAIVMEGPPRLLEQAQALLPTLGMAYRDTARARIASATRPQIRRRHSRRPRPQIATFDSGFTRPVEPLPGTVVAESYARGAHYLPIPSFEGFRRAFRNWWESEPVGWQLRGYEAARAIGWAYQRADGSGDLAAVMERMERVRFGGVDITLGPDDHTLVETTSVGLWTWPRGGIDVRERSELPRELKWVMLQRGFSIDGQRTMVLPEDWRYLFRGKTNPKGPAPKVPRARFGVKTPRKDPVH